MLVIFHILCIFKNTVYSCILFLYFIPFVFCTHLTSVIVTSKGPSIKYVRKIFRKTNISNSLIRTVSFSENFAYVLNELSLTEATFLHAARFFTDFKCKCKENYKCRHFYQL